jgi:hypothetical protein
MASVNVVDVKIERISFKRTTATDQIPDILLDRGEPLIDLSERELWLGIQDGSKEKFKLISKENIMMPENGMQGLPDLSDPVVIYNISKYMNTLYVVPTSEYDGLPATYVIKYDAVGDRYYYADVNNIGYSFVSNELPQPIGDNAVGDKGYLDVLARIDHIHPKGNTIDLNDMNNFELQGVVAGHSEIEIFDNRSFKINIVNDFSDTGRSFILLTTLIYS